MILSISKNERKSQHTIIHPGPELQVHTLNLILFFYFRYKMPKMVLKQESRLNGVKTNIFNLDEVAKSLRVPEEGIQIFPLKTYLTPFL